MDASTTEMALASLGSVLGSSGVWAYFQNRTSTSTARTRLLMGLAYDQLTRLGIQYIERGSITKDEYEDYRKYFFDPYKALGGNGVAERIMREVSQLPFRSHSIHAGIFRNIEPERTIPNVRVVTRTAPEAPAQ